MATTEKMGVITQIDESGNEIILYPKTKAEQVAGLEEKIAGKLTTAKEEIVKDVLAALPVYDGEVEEV